MKNKLIYMRTKLIRMKIEIVYSTKQANEHEQKTTIYSHGFSN